jgi:hypothetical protein
MSKRSSKKKPSPLVDREVLDAIVSATAELVQPAPLAPEASGLGVEGGVAETYLDGLRAELLALSPDSLRPRTFGLDSGGRAALKLVQRARKAEVWPALEDLECQSWSCGAVARLERLGYGALELDAQLAGVKPLPRVDLALATEARERRDRLHKLFLHFFQSDAAALQQGQGIGQRSSHSGVAHDLLRLYQQLAPHRKVLADYPVGYDPEDLARAPVIAREVARRLLEPVEDQAVALRRALAHELGAVFDRVRAALVLVLGDTEARKLVGLTSEDRRRRKQAAAAAAARAKAKGKAKAAGTPAGAVSTPATEASGGEASGAVAGAASAEASGPAPTPAALSPAEAEAEAPAATGTADA